MTKGFKVLATKQGERAVVYSARGVVVYANDVRANDLFETRSAAERHLFAHLASLPAGKRQRTYIVAAA